MNFYFPDIIDKDKYDCEKCGLNQKKIKPTIGSNYNGILIIGDTPTKKDEKHEKHFSSDIFQSFKKTLVKNKINPKMCAFTNITICAGGKITAIQAKCCRSNLVKTIHSLKPKVIISLGDRATNVLLNSYEQLEIKALRNRVIPSYEFNCIIFPTFHPKDIKHINKTDYAIKFALEKDIERIAKLWRIFFHKKSVVNKTLKERKILDNVKINHIKTKKELDKAIDKILKHGSFSFDYETTNAKPL